MLVRHKFRRDEKVKSYVDTIWYKKGRLRPKVPEFFLTMSIIYGKQEDKKIEIDKKKRIEKKING